MDGCAHRFGITDIHLVSGDTRRARVYPSSQQRNLRSLAREMRNQVASDET